ncbi:MAG: hypothetical protein POELPBGB_01387 [Bacteroidia bacterium]|nr:hypothetical protein [Bacteroidia bacterium]
MSKDVGLWIRVSTEDQAQSDSPEHHEKRARMYAEIKNWNVREVYYLLGVSGKSVMEHPETKRMLADIQARKITGLVFSKLARLSRNLKELTEFSQIFGSNHADLISLDESIDTSTPAGRMFYNIMGSLSQWEREEIANRVAKSIPVRAKLGKSLGGEAPFGYKWIDKKLELDEKEAPIRKLLHELFAEHKRKRTVANMLNEKGYRTRNGSKFSDTTIDRLLKDPAAKGLRRVNYTKSSGLNKKWELKPKEDWVFQEVPRIVSDELWEKCNQILDAISSSKTKVRKRTIHLFSSVLQCDCGEKMYMRSKSPKYVCRKCKNKIGPQDLEEIYHSQLKQLLFSETELEKHLQTEQSQIGDKKQLIEILVADIQKLHTKIKDTFELYHEGKIQKDAFESYHKPLYDELKQKEMTLNETQAYIDSIQVQSLSNEQVLHDARDLYAHWIQFSNEEKKTIIEAITENIIISERDITINLSYIPTLTHDAGATMNPNTAIVLPILVQLSNERTWLR